MSANYKDKIKKAVNSLTKATNQDDLEERVRKINELILKSIIVVDDNIEIKPYWVEAYYNYNDEHQNCGAMHNNGIGYPEQQGLGNQFKLYFHKSGRGGVDLVLSNDNISLSILLKCSVLNGECKAQTKLLSNEDKEKYKAKVNLKERKIEKKILNAKRVGIKSSKILATYINIEGLNPEEKELTQSYLYNKMRKKLGE